MKESPHKPAESKAVTTSEDSLQKRNAALLSVVKNVRAKNGELSRTLDHARSTIREDCQKIKALGAQIKGLEGAVEELGKMLGKDNRALRLVTRSWHSAEAQNEILIPLANAANKKLSTILRQANQSEFQIAEQAATVAEKEALQENALLRVLNDESAAKNFKLSQENVQQKAENAQLKDEIAQLKEELTKEKEKNRAASVGL